MVIDYILARRDTEELEGVDSYAPRDFYYDILVYGDAGERIARAMDEGSEEDVKKALCDYIDRNRYSPKIKDYINSKSWLAEGQSKRYQVTIDTPKNFKVMEFEDYNTAVKMAVKYKERLVNLAKDEVEYAKAHSVRSFKARHVGCPRCESKLNREFLTGESCPVCRTDLRAKTTLDKLAWYKEKRKELCSLIEEENIKQKNKATVKWLIKYEYHS